MWASPVLKHLPFPGHGLQPQETAAPTACLPRGPARHESQASRAHVLQQPEAARWTASPAATSPGRLVCGVALGGRQGGPGSLCPLMSPQLRGLVQDRYFYWSWGLRLDPGCLV